MARGKDEDTLRLKRERAGRYVSADGRFAVEGDAAGAWYVIDSERQDGLGLPLVRGPFATLDAARGAVAEARETPVDLSAAAAPAAGPTAPAAPAAGPVAAARKLTAVPSPQAAPKHESRPTSRSKPTPAAASETPPGRPRLRAVERAPGFEPRTRRSEPVPKPPPSTKDRSAARPTRQPSPSQGQGRRAVAAGQDDDPVWLGRLTPEQQAEARRLLSVLERAGIDDPALVRREMEAGLPEVGRALLARTVRRDAIDPWAAGANAIEALASKAVTSAGAGRDPRVRAAKAAVGRVLARGDPEDLALLAWLVALQTSVRIFGGLAGEGRDVGQALRGWRLVELGAGRSATGRTLAIDEPDLVGE